MSSIAKKQETSAAIPLEFKKLEKRNAAPVAPAAAIATTHSVGNLPATISLFQTITEQLTDSYETLTQQVEALRGELALADQALSKEMHAKESISERMEKLLEAMPVAVITLDATGHVDDANPAALDLMGNDVVSRKWANVIDEVFFDTSVCGNELLLKSGRVVSIATQPLSEMGGQVVVLTDLTETRRLQTKIHHLEKLSEMGRMMASLAHQIRTPLSSAMIFAEHLVAGESETSRKGRYASRVMEKLTQLDRQVKDMLIFSKSGFLMNDRVEVGSVITQLVNAAREILDNKNGILRVEGTSVAGMQMQCNRAYLISAFCNLVENAIQACEDQGIHPEMLLKISCENKNMLTLELIDNGPGIEESQLSKVLEPFFTTKANGTGLGLPVVYAVMTGHGGAMDLINMKPQGLMVRIHLPLTNAVTVQ